MAGLRRSAGPRRVVVKVGSRLLTGGTGAPVRERVEAYAAAVSRHGDTRVVLVTSGAVAAGYAALGLTGPPLTRRERQASAAVGQTRLVRLWAEAFAAHGREVGQVLLTNDCLRERRQYLSARQAFATLFEAGIVPVVNENDAVSVVETEVGDNDNLAAYAAALVEADVVVLLTDVEGVYDGDPSDPSSRLIRQAASAAELRPYCWRKRSPESKGGLETKLEAAEKAAAYGIPTVIADGRSPEVVESLLGGGRPGTWILGSERPLRARRHWMAMQGKLRGKLVVDDGALAALCRGGASLLPKGVVGVVGRFDAGEVVAILDVRGVERARGMVAYGDAEVRRIRGRHSDEIEAVLGYRAGREVVRADKVVILNGGRDG